MRFTEQLIKTAESVSKDEVSKNAQLLLRAGFVDKTMAGVYTFLPMGLRVLTNIMNIVRNEMDALGAEEILMPALQPKELWQTTGRWDTFDALYRVHSQNGEHEFALGPTHEEVVTPLVQKFVHSYRDLPRAVYQIQTKFRYEPRAKSGILRGREFFMKDLYSFHLSPEDLANYYERAAAAYANIFKRMDLSALRVRASGGAFSKFSEEYQVPCAAGEDIIFQCACGFAVNKEIAEVKDGDVCPKCGAGTITSVTAIEVGNIFTLNTKFSDAFKFTAVGEDGASKPVYMGCYGIGCSRLLGTIAEVLSDENGLVWPQAIAPFTIHLVRLGEEPEVIQTADDIYEQLRLKGVTVLFDDRSAVAAGKKFADADLIGCPTRAVVSARTCKEAAVEIKNRATQETTLLPVSDFLDRAYV